MIELKKTYTCLLPYNADFHFIVVGVGGTGGYLVPNLARMISVINQTKNKRHSLTLVDGDEVETKNLTRQNFIQSDLDKNKAEVMARRYANAFGIPITSVAKYLETPRDLFEVVSTGNPYDVPVIIGCVDNNKTRQIIHEYFFWAMERKRVIWLDSGNEEFTGQVVFGYNYYRNIDRLLDGNRYEFFAPPVTVLYPDVLYDAESKLYTELSCAERAISAPQSISANITASNILMNFANSILTAGSNDGIKTHQVKFNSKTNVFSTDFFHEDKVLEFPPAYRLKINKLEGI